MKRKRLAGWLGMGLAAVMAAGVLGGCGNTSETSGNSAEESREESTSQSSAEVGQSQESGGVDESEAAAPEVELPESISWWTHDGLNEEDYVKEWDAAFEELSGIRLEHTQVSNNEYQELLEIAFTSQTEPNVFDLPCDQKLAYYASQGAVADLTDLIKESGLYDKIDADVWEAIALDGKIYGIPTDMPTGIVNYVRKDWLDRLNMEVPTNYEEYIEMLRAFRDNIDECTIPLTAPGLTAAMNLPEFYWDAEADFTYKDGKWVDGMLEENFPVAMQRLHDAYAEGLIDVEAVTNTTSNCRDKWYSGAVGVFSYWDGKWGNTLHTRLQENFPEAELIGIPAIDESYYRYTTFSVKCIDGRLSEEEARQVFYGFFGNITDGADGQILFACGVEGLHHEIGEDGRIQYLNMVSAPDSVFQSVWGLPANAVFPFENTDILPVQPDKAVETHEVILEDGVYKFTTPSSETLNTITSDLKAIRDELIAKMVMGDISVEEGMDTYRQKAESLSVDKVLEEMNR